MTGTRALVRPPGPSYPDALTRQSSPEPVNLARAIDQHRAYVEALTRCGVRVTVLSPLDAHPDAVFVQDPVVILHHRAFVADAVEPTRRGEAATLMAALPPDIDIVRLEPPAALEGGDVLEADGRVVVGLSDRTNLSALVQVSDVLAPDVPVHGVPVPAPVLHLLSGCSYLGNGRLLVASPLVSLAETLGLDPVVLPADEAQAANVLVLGRTVVMPAGFRRTAAILEGCDLDVVEVEVGEFAKRDGGVTCLSLFY
jgi:dimethylargininase